MVVILRLLSLCSTCCIIVPIFLQGISVSSLFFLKKLDDAFIHLMEQTSPDPNVHRLVHQILNQNHELKTVGPTSIGHRVKAQTQWYLLVRR